MKDGTDIIKAVPVSVIVAILISGKTDFLSRNIISDNEVHF